MSRVTGGGRNEPPSPLSVTSCSRSPVGGISSITASAWLFSSSQSARQHPSRLNPTRHADRFMPFCLYFELHSFIVTRHVMFRPDFPDSDPSEYAYITKSRMVDSSRDPPRVRQMFCATVRSRSVPAPVAGMESRSRASRVRTGHSR